jgi:hypothetical protein
VDPTVVERLKLVARTMADEELRRAGEALGFDPLTTTRTAAGEVAGADPVALVAALNEPGVGHVLAACGVSGAGAATLAGWVLGRALLPAEVARLDAMSVDDWPPPLDEADDEDVDDHPTVETSDLDGVQLSKVPLGPLPEAVERIAAAASLATLGDVFALDVQEIQGIQGVDSGDVARFRIWKRSRLQNLRSSGSEAMEGSDNLDVPLPEAPSGIALVVNRSGVRTLREAVNLTSEELGALPGVGIMKSRAFQRWVDELVSANASAPTFGGAELPQPPPFLRSAVARLGVTTIEEALSIPSDNLRGIRGFGDGKVRAWRDWQEHLRAAFSDATLVEAPRPVVKWKPSSARDLVTAFHIQDDPRDLALLRGRYTECLTLFELGRVHNVGRERARQLIKRVVSALRDRYAEASESRLAAEWCLGTLGSDVLHRDVRDRPTIDWGHVRLLAEVATGDSWSYVDDGWLTRRSATGLRAARQEASVFAEGVMELSAGAVRTFCAVHPHLSTRFVEVVLEHDLGFERDAAGDWRRDPTTVSVRAYLRARLQETSRPVHQETVGDWIVAHENADRSTLTEDDFVSYARRAESILMRLPEAIRCARGTFVHRDHLDVPVDVQERAIALSLDRMEGTEGPTSTRVLMGIADIRPLIGTSAA